MQFFDDESIFTIEFRLYDYSEDSDVLSNLANPNCSLTRSSVYDVIHGQESRCRTTALFSSENSLYEKSIGA